MGAASAAIDCRCWWTPEPLRLWCATCGGLLPDVGVDDRAAESSPDAIDLYQAVLTDLERLSTRDGADVQRLAAIRSFYEDELSKQIETCAAAEREQTVTAMLAVARDLIRHHPDGLVAARDAIATSQRELPDEPVLRQVAAELLQRMAPPPPLPLPPVQLVVARVVAPPEPSAVPRPALPSLLPEEDVPPPTHRIIEAASQWSQVFKPFLLANVGWFVGAFLILAGFAVLVTTYWRNIDQSEILKYSLLFFSLLGTAAGLLAAAYAMRIRHRDLETASDVLLCLVALLVPLVFAAAVLTTMARGLAGPIIGTAWGGIALWALMIGSRMALGPFGRQASPEFARLMAMICAVTLSAPLLRGLSPMPVLGTLALTGLDYTVAGVVAWGLWKFGDQLLDGLFVDRRLSTYLVLASVANAALVTLACLHFAAIMSFESQVELPASHYAPFLVLLAGLVCFVDQRLARAARRPRLVGRLTFVAYALSLAAVGLSLTPYLHGGGSPFLQSVAAAQTLLFAAVLYAALAYTLRWVVPLYLALFAVVAEYHVVVVQWVLRSSIGIDGWALTCLPLLALFWYGHAQLQRRVAQRVAAGEEDVLSHALPLAIARGLAVLAAVLAVSVVVARFQPGAFHAGWTLVTCLAFAGWMAWVARRDGGAVPRRAVFALLGAAALIGINPAFGTVSAAWLSALAMLALVGVGPQPAAADEYRDVALTAAVGAALLALPALLGSHPWAEVLLARLTLLLSSLVLVVGGGLTGSRLPIHLAALALAAAAPAAIPYAAIVAALVGGGWWRLRDRLEPLAKRLSPTPGGAQWFGVVALPFATGGSEVYHHALREIGLGAALFAVVTSVAGALIDPAALMPVATLAAAAVALGLSSAAYPPLGLRELSLAVALVAIHAGADRLLFAPRPADARWQAHLPLAAAIACAAWCAGALLQRGAAGVAVWAPSLRRGALVLATAVLSVLYIETVLLHRGWLQLAAVAMVGVLLVGATERRETAYLALSVVVLAVLDVVSLAGWRTAVNETGALSALAVIYVVAAACLGSPISDGEQRSARAERWSLPLILGALALVGIALAFATLLAGSERATLVALAAAVLVTVICAALLRIPGLLYLGGAALWGGIYVAFAVRGLPLADAGPTVFAVAAAVWIVAEGLRSGSRAHAWLLRDTDSKPFVLPLLCLAAAMTVVAAAHVTLGWLPLTWYGPQLTLLGIWSGCAVLLGLLARSLASLPPPADAEPRRQPAETVLEASGLSRVASVLALSTLALAIGGPLESLSVWSRIVTSAVLAALFAAIAARLLWWQAARVTHVTRVDAQVWWTSCSAWSAAAIAVSLLALAADIAGDRYNEIIVAETVPPTLAVALVTLTLLQLSAMVRAVLPLAMVGVVVTCLWASADSHWVVPPDLTLAVCGVVCLLPESGILRGRRRSAAVRLFAGAFGDDEVRPLVGVCAVLLLAAAALAAIPLQVALAPGWPSAAVTLGVVTLAIACSAAGRGDERRAMAAALLAPFAAWCALAAAAGVALGHPALPAMSLAIGLTYIVVARLHLLAGVPLLRAVLPRAGIMFVVAGNVAALAMVEQHSWWLVAAGGIAVIAWADIAWNPPLPALTDDRLRDGAVYLAEWMVAATYLYVRHGILGRPFGPNMVTVASVMAASLGLLAVNAVAARARNNGAAPFARVAYYSALILPLALLIVTPRTRAAATMSALAAGAFYMLVAQRARALWALYAAVALWNVALYVWMPVAHAHTGLMQLYVVPAALTVLAMAQLHRHQLSPSALARIRLGATGVILAAATTEVAFSPTFAHFALVLGLSLLGIAVGIALRIRVVVFVGIAFLVLNVLLQLGLQMRTPTGVTRGLLLITVGMLITGGMVLLNLKRGELLRRYHAFIADPSWE